MPKHIPKMTTRRSTGPRSSPRLTTPKASPRATRRAAAINRKGGKR